MNLNGVPIIGQTTITIPQQLRLDASEMVGKVLEHHKQLGLRFGRLGMSSPVQQASAQLLLALEALEAGGCRIVAVNEHPMPTQTGDVALIVNILFRCPESLFASVQA